MSDIIQPPPKTFLQKLGDALVTGFSAAGCCVEPPSEEESAADATQVAAEQKPENNRPA